MSVCNRNKAAGGGHGRVFPACVLLAALLLVLAPGMSPADSGVDLSWIRLPAGFRINIYAQVPNAREMAVDPESGRVFITTRGQGLYTLLDRDGDGLADENRRLLPVLKGAAGVALSGKLLFVSEQDRISRYDIGELLRKGATPAPRVIFDGLPDERWHGSRYARMGPDGWLYVANGSPCNICWPRGLEDSIIRLRADGSGLEVYARGIRNSVGMDFHPRTGELFFDDNNVDNMGDDIPPGELNRVSRPGQHFGFPYYAGGHVRHPDFELAEPPAVVFPVLEYQAHTAPLGLGFYHGDQFPADYRNDLFVAQHGSWNRTIPVGYRVMRIHFDAAGLPVGKSVFASGWLQADGRVLGRPADVQTLPDGSLLVTDDHAGRVYRIHYAGTGR